MNNMYSCFSLLLLATFCTQHCVLTLSYISPLDKSRLLKVVEDGWKLTDVNNLHYAVASYTILKEDFPVADKVICDYLADASYKSDKLEDLYHVVSIWKSLSSCKKPFTVKKIPALTSTSVEDKFYWNYINEFINDNSSKNVPSHRVSTTIDESIIGMGFSLHLAALPSISVADTRVEFNKIAKIILRADEVDGQFLQYEGGLAATALVITGIYKVSEKLNELPALKNEQVVKFAKYFLSRNTVSRPKGVYFLLEAMHTLVNNKFHLIASVETVDKTVSVDKTSIAVRVSDLLGNLLVDNSMFTIKARRKGQEEVKTGLSLTTTDLNTVYAFNPKDLNLDMGFHSIDVLLSLTKDGALSKKVIVNPVNAVSFIIATDVSVSNFQIGVSEADRSSAADMSKVEYGSILSEELSLDSLQRLIIKFAVKDANSGKSLRIHQAFVKFTNAEENENVLFVATPDGANNYRLYVDVGSSAPQFHYLSGKYNVTLILGDSKISSATTWTTGIVNLRFPVPEQEIVSEDVASYYLPKPEIKHTFKEPEKRPPVIVSLTFTILVLSPLLILFVLWTTLRINISNFPFTLSAVGFHAGLACIFALFGIFWLQLNMFQTIKYLLAIGIVTFLCGNKMLVGIASKRSKASSIN